MNATIPSSALPPNWPPLNRKMTELTTDIQRALQNAIGEANNAFSQSTTTGTGPSHSHAGKRKKRTRDLGDEGESEVEPEWVGGSVGGKKKDKEKKKKRGRKQRVEDAGEDEGQGTGKEHVDIEETTALDHPPHHQQPHYLTYPPSQMGYSYPPPQPSADSTNQTLFPLPDLAFTSPEDILRAIQYQDLDIDMSKIANVLKTLGEAAAAASVQSHSQTQTAGAVPAPPPPPLNQVPSTAGDILISAGSGEPKQVKPSRNAIDMSAVTAGGVGVGQEVNVDHSYLLANKWMNAGKLAEMVKHQGKSLVSPVSLSPYVSSSETKNDALMHLI